MKQILSFVLLITILLACKKDNDQLQFSIHGKVTDDSFQTSLSNATVTIMEKGVGSYWLKNIGTTTTDSEGNYTLKFPRNRAELYQVHVVKDNYFEEIYTINFSDLDPKESKMYNFKTTAFSWVKVHLKNTETINDYDQFIYRKTIGRTNCETCCSNEDQVFYGALDTVIYCKTDGNKPFAYYYQLSNTSTLGTIQQNTVAFDTIELYTNY